MKSLENTFKDYNLTASKLTCFSDTMKGTNLQEKKVSYKIIDNRYTAETDATLSGT